MLHAIDVSHHQFPSALNWRGMRQAGCDICIVRLAYGTKMDEKAVEHIARARDADFAVGVYVFARPTQSLSAQWDVFEEMVAKTGYGLPDDLLPALDIEDDTPARPLTPEHQDFYAQYAGLFAAWNNNGAYAYITARDWGRLGRPGFVLTMPLFVAHYASPSRLEPATPNGMRWDIW